MAEVNALIECRARHALDVLAQHVRFDAARLFGSHVDGLADQWSDIDLAVFIERLESWDIRDRAKTVALVQKEAGDDIELHFFPAEALTQPETASFAAFVLTRGIPLEPPERHTLSPR